MRKTFFLIGIFAVLVPVAEAANLPEKLYVKIRSARLREEPKQWAPSKAEVSYGDALEKLDDPKDGWIKVKSARGGGFIHLSALTDQRVVLNNKAELSSVPDSADVVIAGKGFDSKVEAEASRKNPSLNFRAVNSMENTRVTSRDPARSPRPEIEQGL